LATKGKEGSETIRGVCVIRIEISGGGPAARTLQSQAEENGPSIESRRKKFPLSDKNFVDGVIRNVDRNPKYDRDDVTF